jgi:alkylation response protein AidB-like acyl-CoA dehydrogenase
MESVEAFQQRAQAWMDASLPSLDDSPVGSSELQALLFDNGFAGIAFPREYGGAGLTLEHQKAFYDTAIRRRRQVPTAFVASIGMLGPTILDHGSHEPKLRFLPPLLRGDEVWIQLLSEPASGSDMAGSITRLARDGDTYMLNGAKIWSSGAYNSDFGLCLCRTDWNAPKHRGLSMIAVPLQGVPGVTIERIRSASGIEGEFCQEFFDDVVLPAGYLIGEENNGWAVAQTLLFHERNAVGTVGYGYFGIPWKGSNPASQVSITAEEMAAVAWRRGTTRGVAAAIADAYIESVVCPLTSIRIQTGMRVGTHRGQWGSLLKLQGSVAGHEAERTALGVLGADAVIWDSGDVRLDNMGTAWLGSRSETIAGGTSEMQRNIVSERLLGLPREPANDRNIPFSEVIRNPGQNH